MTNEEKERQGSLQSRVGKLEEDMKAVKNEIGAIKSEMRQGFSEIRNILSGNTKKPTDVGVKSLPVDTMPHIVEWNKRLE